MRKAHLEDRVAALDDGRLYDRAVPRFRRPSPAVTTSGMWTNSGPRRPGGG